MQHTLRCTTLSSIDMSPNQHPSAGTLLPRSEKATSVESAISLQVTRLQSTGPLLSLVFPHFLPAVTTNKMLSPRAYPRFPRSPQSLRDSTSVCPRKKPPQLLLGIHRQVLPNPLQAGPFSAPLGLTLGWTPGSREDEELSLYP